MGWSVLARHCLGALVSGGGRTDGRLLKRKRDGRGRQTDRQPCLWATLALEATLPLETLVAECQSIVDYGRNSFYCLVLLM